MNLLAQLVVLSHYGDLQLWTKDTELEFWIVEYGFQRTDGSEVRLRITYSRKPPTRYGLEVLGDL